MTGFRLGLVVIIACLIVMVFATIKQANSQGLPPGVRIVNGVVLIPEATVRTYPKADLDRAKALATLHGIPWRIVKK